MTSFRRLFTGSIRRRVAALAVAFCALGTQAERLLPDLHDGDAEIAHVAGADSQKEPARGPTEAPAHSSQAVHVDHCAHAHVFASSQGPGDAFFAVSAMGAPRTAAPFPASVTAAPLSRPPIA